MELNKQSSAEEVSKFLEDWINCFEDPIVRGEIAGNIFLNSHRYMQGLIVNFMLSTLYTLAKEECIDERNKPAIDLCRIVKKATKGEYQFYI